MGVDGVGSFTAMLPRLRFPVAFPPFTGVSLGVSGAGAASSRARALVDRRGSDMTTWAIECTWGLALCGVAACQVSFLQSDARDGPEREALVARNG